MFKGQIVGVYNEKKVKYPKWFYLKIFQLRRKTKQKNKITHLFQVKERQHLNIKTSFNLLLCQFGALLIIIRYH